MTEIEYSNASEAESLCKACGLCCTGHLFSWVQIKNSERVRLGKLGLPIIQPGPGQYGFTQPCSQWNGQCAIYDSTAYPSGCRSYNCKLLRELLDESVSLPGAVGVVRRAKRKIRDVEKLLPSLPGQSFRDRFSERLEYLKKSASLDSDDADFQSKANDLLEYLEKRFGGNDVVGVIKAE